MPGPAPLPFSFPEAFLQEARRTARRRIVPLQDVQRSRLALLLHERPTIRCSDAARLVGLSTRQTQRWRSRWRAGNCSIDDQPGRGRKASFSPT